MLFKTLCVGYKQDANNGVLTSPTLYTRQALVREWGRAKHNTAMTDSVYRHFTEKALNISAGMHRQNSKLRFVRRIQSNKS